jgi:hypothetical protein
MRGAPLGTHALPVQGWWGFHRRLPERGAAVGQRLGVGMMVESIRPYHPCVGTRHVQQPPLEKIGDRQRHPLPEGSPRHRLRPGRALGEGDAVPIPGHQPRVLEGTAPQVAC